MKRPRVAFWVAACLDRGMRAPLILPILLTAMGACGQSLAPNMTGAGGIPTGAGGFVTGAGATGGAIAGAGGQGGSNGGPNCASLMADYQWYMPLATSCLVGESDQCQQPISAG